MSLRDNSGGRRIGKEEVKAVYARLNEEVAAANPDGLPSINEVRLTGKKGNSPASTAELEPGEIVRAVIEILQDNQSLLEWSMVDPMAVVTMWVAGIQMGYILGKESFAAVV
jgi:hypothetical protein